MRFNRQLKHSPSMFTESREIGAISLKASSLIELQLSRSMEQIKIVNLFKKQCKV